MSFFLSTVLSYLLLYKYIALSAITFSAALILPLPSDTALLATGAFASQGYFNIYIVLIIGLAGNILGDLTGFIISRRYGREFLIKIGLRKLINSRRFIGLEKFLTENSGPTIFISRFVAQVGPWVNILSGLSGLSFKKFFLYEATGEFTDVIVLGLAGYFLGSSWQNLTLTIELIGALLIVLLVAFIFGRIYFRSLNR